MARKPQAQPQEAAIVFEASFAPIATAVSLDGLGDGGMIKLCFDRTGTDAVKRMQERFAGKTFYVVAVPSDKTEDEFSQILGSLNL